MDNETARQMHQRVKDAESALNASIKRKRSNDRQKVKVLLGKKEFELLKILIQCGVSDMHSGSEIHQKFSRQMESLQRRMLDGTLKSS